MLQRLATYCGRVVQVVKNTVQQLAMLYSSRVSNQAIDPRGVHLDTIFAALGEILGVMAILDKILVQNEVIHLLFLRL